MLSASINLCVNCCLVHSVKDWILMSKKCIDWKVIRKQETLVDVWNYFSRCLRLWILFITSCIKTLLILWRTLCCESSHCWHAPHRRRSSFSLWTTQSQQTSKASLTFLLGLVHSVPTQTNLNRLYLVCLFLFFLKENIYFCTTWDDCKVSIRSKTLFISSYNTWHTVDHQEMITSLLFICSYCLICIS